MHIFGITKRGMFLWGLFFALVGTVILLSNYGILFKFSRDWPMILIAYGLWAIISGLDRRRRIFWGIFIALLGTIILLSNYEVPWFSFKLSRDWPIILIALGILKIIDVFSGRDRYKSWCKSEATQNKDYRKIIEDLKDGSITAEEAIKKMKE